MKPDSLWVRLQDSPLLWLSVTLAAYLAGRALNRAARGSALVNPVLVAIALVATLLLATGTPYGRYLEGARALNLLLGPATVALAVPLVVDIERVRRSLFWVGVAVVAGSLTASVTGVTLTLLLGGSREVAVSMAPKAATTPIAMAVSAQAGGLPALSAVFAILGGIIAAISAQGLMRRAGVADWRARGLAAGVAGGGVAGAHVATLSEAAAAFAALGIGLNGVVTALVTPILVRLI